MKQKVNLKNNNTLAVSCLAEWLIEVNTAQDIVEAVERYPDRLFDSEVSSRLVLGEGSNVVLPSHFSGIVLLNKIKGIQLLDETDDYVLVRVGGGENWHQFVQDSLERGWFGLENLSLIPGTVGASPVQNIGAYGTEVSQYVEWVEYYDFNKKTFNQLSGSECDFHYRESVFKRAPLREQTLITHVVYRLDKHWSPNIEYGPLQELRDDKGLTPQKVAQQVIKVRSEKLPLPEQLPNAGSFFKNPIVSTDKLDEIRKRYPDIVSFPHGENVKLAAGWMIDQAGWKGHRNECVGVHDKQALVLVNHNAGTGEDILKLAADLQSDVKDKFDVELEIEPRIYV